ncbi:hypothetical protein MNL76_08530 [Fervidobacterium riparium]|nr:hypothetical protein IB67_10305 [Fervidobacterium riparium]
MKLKLLDTKSWELVSGNSGNQHLVRINKAARSYKFFLLKNKRIDNVNFIGMVPIVSSEEEIFYKRRVIERSIRISNEVKMVELPEVIDCFDVLTSSGFKLPMVVTEYINGRSLIDCVETNGLNGYEGTNWKDYINLQRLSRILKKLVKIQEHFMEYNLAHIGFFPEHLILQVDDTVRITSFRSIVGTEGQYVTDKAILEVEKYGPLYREGISGSIIFNYQMNNTLANVKSK